MLVRTYRKTDYKTVSNWWNRYDEWQAVPEDFLPETGFVAFDSDGEVAAAFCYKTDSGFALLEWHIANPDTTKEQRADALDSIIERAILWGKANNFKAFFSSVKHPRLIARYEKHGFIKSDENMTNFVGRL
jgi:hypothetical protein